MDQIKIGKFIASLRKEHGLTQMQFAEKLGVTNKAVSKWETGRCLPDVALFSEICDLLGITINEFFAGERISPEEIVSKSEENLLSIASEYQKNDNNPGLHVLLFGVSMAMIVFSILITDKFIKPVWISVASILFGVSFYKLSSSGRKSLEKMRIISLVALIFSMFCVFDLGMNFSASLVSDMYDGLGVRSQLHAVFRVFGDSLWSQRRFYLAFEYSLWIFFLLSIENIMLWVYIRKSDDSQRTKNGTWE